MGATNLFRVTAKVRYDAGTAFTRPCMKDAAHQIASNALPIAIRRLGSRGVRLGQKSLSSRADPSDRIATALFAGASHMLVSGGCCCLDRSNGIRKNNVPSQAENFLNDSWLKEDVVSKNKTYCSPSGATRSRA